MHAYIVFTHMAHIFTPWVPFIAVHCAKHTDASKETDTENTTVASKA